MMIRKAFVFAAALALSGCARDWARQNRSRRLAA
jgi:hypothetical protein